MVFQVAIDGPSASGKSSIAKNVAKHFNFVHINTGLMYRAIAYKTLKQKINLSNEAQIVNLIKETTLNLTPDQKVFIDGQDVSPYLKEVSLAASTISGHPLVREQLVALQQDMARTVNCVMDGRDIGTIVLPNADLKIFITADVEERARRRYCELDKDGVSVVYHDVLEDMKKRDYQDANRPVGPLKQAKDAIRIDTTGNTFEKSVNFIIDIIRQVYEERKEL